MSGNNTTSSVDDLNNPYNYVPTHSVAIIFLVLFGISTFFHLGASLKYRMWFLLPTAVLAGVGEIIGWVGRDLSSRNVYDGNAFTAQITCTIIAPTPLLAANFIIFGRLASRLGEQYSRVTARWYSIIFLTCDVISLVIQAAGGGIASTASDNNNLPLANTGSRIMLAGIVFQLISLIVFMALTFEFYFRFFSNRPFRRSASNASSSTLVPVKSQVWTGKLKLQSFGIQLSNTVLFIRAIYRTIELADGWNGRIISTQVYFNVLDGAMVVIAMYTLNVLHPGCLLAENESQLHIEAAGEAKSSTQTSLAQTRSS